MCGQIDARATLLGRRVLKSLAAGRQKAIAAKRERARFWMRVLVDYLSLDMETGHPAWGRSERIAKKLHGRLSARMVRKYLERFTSGSESIKYSVSTQNGGSGHGRKSARIASRP